MASTLRLWPVVKMEIFPKGDGCPALTMACSLVVYVYSRSIVFPASSDSILLDETAW